MREESGNAVINKIVPWLVALVMPLLIGYYFYGETNQARAALCVLKHDYVQRTQDSEKYLDDVRSGKRKRIPGITDQDIIRGIRNLRANVDALSSLHC